MSGRRRSKRHGTSNVTNVKANAKSPAVTPSKHSDNEQISHAEPRVEPDPDSHEPPSKRRKTAVATPADLPYDGIKSPRVIAGHAKLAGTSHSAKPDVQVSSDSVSVSGSDTDAGSNTGNRQIVYDSTDSDEDSDDDEYSKLFASLDVAAAAGDASSRSEKADVDIQLMPQRPAPILQRAPRSQRAARQDFRRRQLDAHKVHLCCFIAHAHMRNHWCNDAKLQSILQHVLDENIVEFLHPSEAEDQATRSLTFMRGIEEATKSWKDAWNVSKQGITRPSWAASRSEFRGREEVFERDGTLAFEGFIRAAQTMKESRDVGQQLFCALLRSVGVEARLVASPQILPLHGLPFSIEFLSKDSVPHSRNVPQSKTPARGARSSTPPPGDEKPRPIRRRFGASASRFNTPAATRRNVGAPLPARERKTAIDDQPHPTFWVEVFNPAIQRYIPVDPLHTGSVSKLTRLQPPEDSIMSSFTYAMAFNPDGSMRDVTRRYARAYNAKTRRLRVDATEEGQQWMRRVLKLFKLPRSQRQDEMHDREQIEDGELMRKDRAEPIPRGVQDFKGHPIYALERHLKAHQVIHPRKEAGKVQIGGAYESIFRASSVKTVRSAEKWYRQFGREIKAGEAPLKYGKSRRREEDGESGEVGLYAEDQTELLMPAAVHDGKLKKNVFGNVEVFVPSMIPPGAVHIRCSEAVKAARLCGIDYAEAVTGFKFQGRKGTAVTRGVIMAKEYRAAVELVCLGLWEIKKDEERQRAEKAVLRVWRRFILGVRIQERVGEAFKDGEEKGQKTHDEESLDDEYRAEGGFDLAEGNEATGDAFRNKMPAMDEDEVERIQAINQDDQPLSARPKRTSHRDYLEPTVPSPWPDLAPLRSSPARPAAGFLPDSASLGGGGFISEDADLGGGFVPEMSQEMVSGGGFVPEESHEMVLPDRKLDQHSESQAQEKREDEDELFEEVDAAGGGFFRDPSPEASGAMLPDGGGFIAEDDGRATNGDVQSTDAVRDEGKSLGAAAESKPEPEPEPEPELEAVSESDRGSMLSHDPEDDDMEPDWLVNGARM